MRSGRRSAAAGRGVAHLTSPPGGSRGRALGPDWTEDFPPVNRNVPDFRASGASDGSRLNLTFDLKSARSEDNAPCAIPQRSLRPSDPERPRVPCLSLQTAASPVTSGARARPRSSQIDARLRWLAHLDDPQRQPPAREPRRAEGRRPPGLLRVDDHDPDGALFPRAEARGPGRGEAARQPGVPRRPVSDGPPDPRAARGVPQLRRRAVLSVAHQGQGRRRLLHRLGRPGRGDHRLRLADAGLPGRPRLAGARRTRARFVASWATPSWTRATSTSA